MPLDENDLGDVPAVLMLDEANTNTAGMIKSKFEEAESGRYQHEQRWLKAYKNFRGIYDSTTQFRDSEQSRVFIKITKTKVLAAYGQIIDVLFASKKFPITVESTPVPEGIAEFAHLSKTPQGPEQPPTENPYGFEGDDKELLPGALEATEKENPLGGLAERYEGANLEEGPSKLGEPQIAPAREAARLMEKAIHDQLHENNAVNVLRHSMFESTLLGTGIIKGPLNESKVVHKWGQEKKYEPYSRMFPCSTFKPLSMSANICASFTSFTSRSGSMSCDIASSRIKLGILTNGASIGLATVCRSAVSL